MTLSLYQPPASAGSRLRGAVASCSALLLAAAVAWSGCGWADAQSFLGDDPIVATPKVLADDRVFIQSAPVPVQDKGLAAAEVEILRKQIEKERLRREAVEARLAGLSESLAEANRVSEEQAKAHQELKLKVQALGVDLLKADPSSLEQRLLKAVRALDVSQQSNKKLVNELTSISEVLVNTLEASPEIPEEARDQADIALQSASQVLGQTAGPEIEGGATIKDGKVVSIDAEVGLIVLNIGRKSGARIGMPIEVMRDDRSIGTALVVDVRDRICGAVLNEVSVQGVAVKVGDRVRPRPNEGA